MKKNEYPGLFLRVKSTVIDSIIIVIFMVITTDIFSNFENVPNYIRGIAFVFIFLLYDPLMVSFFGGTIGHKINFIKVQHESKDSNISLLSAIIRYIVKTTLGWFSLLTISARDDRKAIHDSIAKTIVVFEKKRNANTHSQGTKE